ncbi:MAG: hypothetical protein ACREA0_34900 [bacterium]
MNDVVPANTILPTRVGGNRHTSGNSVLRRDFEGENLVVTLVKGF